MTSFQLWLETVFWVVLSRLVIEFMLWYLSRLYLIIGGPTNGHAFLASILVKLNTAFFQYRFLNFSYIFQHWFDTFHILDIQTRSEMNIWMQFSVFSENLSSYIDTYRIKVINHQSLLFFIHLILISTLLSREWALNWDGIALRKKWRLREFRGGIQGAVGLVALAEFFSLVMKYGFGAQVMWRQNRTNLDVAALWATEEAKTLQDRRAARTARSPSVPLSAMVPWTIHFSRLAPYKNVHSLVPPSIVREPTKVFHLKSPFGSTFFSTRMLPSLMASDNANQETLAKFQASIPKPEGSVRTHHLLFLHFLSDACLIRVALGSQSTFFWISHLNVFFLT